MVYHWFYKLVDTNVWFFNCFKRLLIQVYGFGYKCIVFHWFYKLSDTKVLKLKIRSSCEAKSPQELPGAQKNALVFPKGRFV